MWSSKKPASARARIQPSVLCRSAVQPGAADRRTSLVLATPPCTIELRARLYPKYKPAVWAVFGHTAQLAELFYTGVRDEPNIYVLIPPPPGPAPGFISFLLHSFCSCCTVDNVLSIYLYISGFLIKYPLFKVELYYVACKYCCCFTYVPTGPLRWWT